MVPGPPYFLVPALRGVIFKRSDLKTFNSFDQTMKKILFIAIIVAFILSTGCNSRAHDPKLVLTDFFEAMSKKDIPKARNLATADSRPTLDLIEMAMRTSVGENTFFDLKGKKFGEATIEGDRAVVPVTEVNNGVNLEYVLKKENDSWKVAFDKNAFIDMGIEKMKSLRMNSDSALDVLDEIKHIDIDSLKRSFE